MDTTASFSEWLKRQRKARDLTQLDLAERLGCSESAIRKFELGERRPSKQVAELLADFFRVGESPEERADFIRFARGRDLPVGPDQSSTSDFRPSTSDFRPSTFDPRLPAQLTLLIGRRKEVASVRSLLSHEGVRLLTLTGPPGIGKTRLALQVASELVRVPAAGQFEHGVFFVPLAPITDPDLVITTIAQALGVKDAWGAAPEGAGGKSVVAGLIQILEGKRLLIVLDNFEQVVSAAPVLPELLSACPHLKALVTSREVLHVRGEQQFHVPALALPDPAHLPGAEELQSYPAVSLFVQRARAVKPGFLLTNENAEAVAAVCVYLEGLPLAIELAAARTNLLTAQEIRARLQLRARSERAKEGTESSLKLLTGGARDLPPRQQTLRGAIDWSYTLLSPGEQTLFARLGVFVGGCTLSAAEAVCNSMGDLPFDTLDGLSSLIAKSLLSVREGSQREGAPSESRYLMLEMVREYALEKLEASGEGEAIRRQHVQYYLSLAEAARQRFSGPEQSLWLDWLERDHDNLRAALRRLLQHGDSMALRLCGALWYYWEIRGYLSEGRRWLDEALLSTRDQLTIDRAYVAHLASGLAIRQGEYERARVLASEGLHISRELDNKLGKARALHVLGITHENLGDYEQAHAYYSESLLFLRELGDGTSVARVLNSMGVLLRTQGDHAGATEVLNESLSIHRRESNKRSIALALTNLGLAELAQRSYDRAREHFTESLALAQDLRHKVGIADSLAGLAGVACGAGEPVRAARLFCTADELYSSVGYELEPCDKAIHDLYREAARSQLGEVGFEEACAEGKAMSMEQAVAYALEQG